MLFFIEAIFFLSLGALVAFVFLEMKEQKRRGIQVPEDFMPRSASASVAECVHMFVPVEKISDTAVSVKRTLRARMAHFGGVVAGKTRDALLALAKAIEGREVMRKKEAVSFFLKHIGEHKKFLKEQNDKNRS